MTGYHKPTTTIKEIADKLGISVSTVSRVLNGVGRKYRISQNTIDLVKKTAEEYNFKPNELARGLRLKKTFTLGLLVPDIGNPFFGRIASTLEKAAREYGYSTIICASDEKTTSEKKALDILLNRMVDGILASPIGIDHTHFLKAYKEGTPLVLIDRYFMNTEMPYVTFDDEHGAYDASKLLLDNGHKKIACIQGLVETTSNVHRLNGYKKALKEYDISFDPEMVVGEDFSEMNGYNQAKLLLSRSKEKRPTAIFSFSNLITIGILKAFKEDNIDIPKDISIVSFDEQEYSELLYTPITTVIHTSKEMSQKALEILLEQINSKDRKTNQNIVFPTSLVIRESVKNIK